MGRSFRLNFIEEITANNVCSCPICNQWVVKMQFPKDDFLAFSLNKEDGKCGSLRLFIAQWPLDLSKGQVMSKEYIEVHEIQIVIFARDFDLYSSGGN